jgi:hypothetical protein
VTASAEARRASVDSNRLTAAIISLKQHVPRGLRTSHAHRPAVMCVRIRSIAKDRPVRSSSVLIVASDRRSSNTLLDCPTQPCARPGPRRSPVPKCDPLSPKYTTTQPGSPQNRYSVGSNCASASSVRSAFTVWGPTRCPIDPLRGHCRVLDSRTLSAKRRPGSTVTAFASLELSNAPPLRIR